MSEELYEELPADDIQEDLYEDLPDSAYAAASQYPAPVSPPYNYGPPPPLPTGPIPQQRQEPPPKKAAAPPLPTRSPSTSVTSAPPPRKQDKKAPPKKKTAPPPKPAKSSSGGAGIDMNEIMKKARSNADRSAVFEQLENKGKPRSDDGDSKPAPWASQLKKTGTLPRQTKEDTSIAPAPAPWTKRNSHVETDDSKDVPEFVKKARTFSVTSNESDEPNKPPSPETTRKPSFSPKPAVGRKPIKPPPVAKPRNPPGPEGFLPKALNGPDTEEKPQWLKQRERQVSLAQGEQERPPAPSSKPPPSIPNGPTVAAKPPVKKPPPKPVPRKPVEVPPPVNVKGSQEDIPQHESPPHTPSVRERARTMERSAKQILASPPDSPPPPPPVETAPPKPAPKPPAPVPEEPLPTPPERPPPTSRPPPSEEMPALPDRPPPTSRPPPSEEMPALPDRPPPTSRPPPSEEMPALPDRPPPSSRPPPEGAVPPLPVRPPPSSRPAPPTIPSKTEGLATPPTPQVMTYRRRPLRVVDMFSPPQRPPVSTKPIPTEDEEEDIYDDTVAQQDDEELYDDVSATQAPPPRPLPTITPPIDSGPPGETPPPLPVSLPPSSRPSIPSSSSDTGLNGGTSDLGLIPTDDQEMYEDLEAATEAYATAQAAMLAPQPPLPHGLEPPPSPVHPGSSPSPSRKDQKLTKKQQKEEEKKEKERKRLEREREKERKKKEEAHTKNKLKGIKAFKQFDLKPDVEPLFAVEVLLEHPKTKDHLNFVQGEVARVILLNHPKLPIEKYLVEKEDGTIGYLKKNISQRTAYQSTASVLGTALPSPSPAFQDDEDIYESLPQGDEDGDFLDALNGSTPSLPPPNAMRFPPPSQPAPPPPLDGPEDNYEYLPEPQLTN